MGAEFSYFMATDSLAIDKRAPWMDKAHEALRKGAKEFKTQDSFAKLLYVAMVQDEIKGARHPLLKPILEEAVKTELDLERPLMASRNAQIAKFLSTVKTDPRYGKSSSLPLIGHGDPKTLAAKGNKGKGQTAHWQVTAWCAAFVNWCLVESGSPHLGFATASSWLDFGTPLAAAVRGCITVMPPMSSTGGGTGHVAFFVKRHGNITYLLGGNQHDEIRITGYEAKPVGYRWPTSFNYLLTESTRSA
jgi:uncharacterized protein (TIGR02594 family)